MCKYIWSLGLRSFDDLTAPETLSRTLVPFFISLPHVNSRIISTRSLPSGNFSMICFL